MVYLDNAATTFPKPDSVYQTMDAYNRNAVNAGRGSYKKAKEATDLIADTKNRLLSLVDAPNGHVVFSPSLTIALNQIIGGYTWKDNAVIYISPYEHNAVARTLHHLSSKSRIKIKQLPLCDDLSVDLSRTQYEFAKEPPTAIICTHVSNVTGYVLPIKSIFNEGKKYNSINILDTAQSLGLIPLSSGEFNVDIIAFAGHKTLYGPLGIGGFINVSSIYLDSVLCGGTGSDSLNLDMPNDFEKRFEPASSNIVAIAGLNQALKVVDINQAYASEMEITNYLLSSLESLDNIIIYSPYKETDRIGMVSFNVTGYTSDQVGLILDEDFDIAVRTGFHCAPFIHSFLDDMSYLGTVRASVGQFTTKSDIDCLISAINTL